MQFFQGIITWIATFGMFIYGVFAGVNGTDFIGKYKDNVASVPYYENSIDTAVPQTKMYDVIKEHFESELPKGKTTKKLIVIGYDGGRADALTLSPVLKKSAIRTLSENGGSVLITYSGGKNYPYINTQKTSTAPGWCSILTGKWANETGVSDNSIPKSNDNLTLLTTLVENKTIDSSAFYVSWNGHFIDDDSTYINEKNYVESKKLAVSFKDAGDDNGTLKFVTDDLSKTDCSDFIFSIFEYPDHAGHGTGFGYANEDYVKAFEDNEATAYDIIKLIESRPTYDTEDWMILLMSDHGGYNTGHGGPTIQERMTFVASNKKITIK